MQFDVTAEKDGMMLSRLLLQVADVPQWAIKQAMKNRDVRVDGVRLSGDVRVRVLHNERDAELPIGGGPYYPWETLRDYCKSLYE